jgi:hypothetical protein
MWYLAQTYNYQVDSNSGIGVGLIILYLVFVIIAIAAYWKIFTKAGQAGWKVLIPIYNAIITLRIVGMSGWYVVLFLIPFVNIVMSVVVAYKIAKAFGYGIGMTILEFFLIGALILGYGSAKYLGPEGKDKPAGASPPKPQSPPSTSPAVQA